MNTTVNFPTYFKVTIILIGLSLVFVILSIGKSIMLPIVFSILIAILVNPAVNFLVKKGVHRTLSIAIILTATLLLVITAISIITSQATLLIEAWPTLEGKFRELLNEVIKWLSETFNLSPQKSNSLIDNAKSELMKNGSGAIGSTLTGMGNILAMIFLLPVYVFMILYYQPHIITFLHKLFGASNNIEVRSVLSETKTIIQSYLVGLFAEIGIVAVLNSLGLFILGINYALLLGTLGAILNVIPYLGGLISVAIFVIIALATKSSIYALYVMAMYTIIQFIDNNYLVPRIVGSKVKLNALASLIVIFIGAALWGLAGMFLSIPILATLKIIFDHIDSLHPWGFLIGNMASEEPNKKGIRHRILSFKYKLKRDTNN
ncbi:MAG: AI-2E family transporter [Bacteroidetes bacterium]|nr:AI-2E family transporter [Bacteroidota bacterium]